MNGPALWTKHRPLARGIAREYRIPGCESQDVEQEALIGLWIATGKWDRDTGPFPAFARSVIHRRLITILRTALRQKRPRFVEWPDNMVELAGGADPVRVVIGRERLAAITEALGGLSVLERESIVQALNGQPRDRVHGQAVNRARRKLKAAA